MSAVLERRLRQFESAASLWQGRYYKPVAESSGRARASVTNFDPVFAEVGFAAVDLANAPSEFKSEFKGGLFSLYDSAPTEAKKQFTTNSGLALESLKSTFGSTQNAVAAAIKNAQNLADTLEETQKAWMTEALVQVTDALDSQVSAGLESVDATKNTVVEHFSEAVSAVLDKVDEGVNPALEKAFKSFAGKIEALGTKQAKAAEKLKAIKDAHGDLGRKVENLKNHGEALAKAAEKPRVQKAEDAINVMKRIMNRGMVSSRRLPAEVHDWLNENPRHLKSAIEYIMASNSFTTTHPTLTSFKQDYEKLRFLVFLITGKDLLEFKDVKEIGGGGFFTKSPKSLEWAGDDLPKDFSLAIDNATQLTPRAWEKVYGLVSAFVLTVYNKLEGQDLIDSLAKAYELNAITRNRALIA